MERNDTGTNMQKQTKLMFHQSAAQQQQLLLLSLSADMGTSMPGNKYEK